MSTGDDLPQSAPDSFNLPDPPGPTYTQHAWDAHDPSGATGTSDGFDAFDEPATLLLPQALPAPSTGPERPVPPIRRWGRGGVCLYAAAGAGVLVVVLCASLGVVALRAGLSAAGAPRGAASDEANRIAILTRTSAGTGTPTPLPGATFAPMPDAVISFGGGAASATSEQCNGLAPLDPVTLALSNAHSTISVDWWMQITDTTPDGKLLWASGMPPYGTLRAGQSTVVEIDPDPTLCSALSSATSPVTYHATVFYGGVSGFTISVVVVPPGPGQQVASTPAVRV